VHCRVLRRNLEATHVRRQKEERLALRPRRERPVDALDLAYQAGNLGVGPEPQQRKLGEHLSGGGDGLPADARVAVPGLLEIRAQVTPVGGRHPIDRPSEDGSQRVQQRQRQFPGKAQEDAGEARQDFGILAASHRKARTHERISVYF
jgi:hypothetical protein